jgi:hypothetical protein
MLVVAACFGARPGNGPATPEAPEYGPSNGTLLIAGGGPLLDSGIVEKFIELAGGPGANFIVDGSITQRVNF